MQCCELDECDFWQCEINQYADCDDFLDDTDPNTPWLSRITGHEKGALVQLMPIEQVSNILEETATRMSHSHFKTNLLTG